MEEGTMGMKSVDGNDGDVNDDKEESTVHIKKRRKLLFDNDNSNTIGSLEES
jgi:hypothetical protein